MRKLFFALLFFIIATTCHAFDFDMREEAKLIYKSTAWEEFAPRYSPELIEAIDLFRKDHAAGCEELYRLAFEGDGDVDALLMYGVALQVAEFGGCKVRRTDETGPVPGDIMDRVHILFGERDGPFIFGMHFIYFMAETTMTERQSLRGGRAAAGLFLRSAMAGNPTAMLCAGATMIRRVSLRSLPPLPRNAGLSDRRALSSGVLYPKETLYWLISAALGGNGQAALYLGKEFYAQGRLDLAAHYFLKSVDKGNAEAGDFLLHIYSEQDLGMYDCKMALYGVMMATLYTENGDIVYTDKGGHPYGYALGVFKDGFIYGGHGMDVCLTEKEFSTQEARARRTYAYWQQHVEEEKERIAALYVEAAKKLPEIERFLEKRRRYAR